MTENNCDLRNSESGELVGAQQEGSIPGAGSLGREPGSRDLTTASLPAQMNGWGRLSTCVKDDKE